jgi:hypothetical protein
MEKDYLLCPQCGQRLAQLLGEIGQRRRLEPLGRAKPHTATNALGERFGWIDCPKCKARRSIDPASLPGEG